MLRRLSLSTGTLNSNARAFLQREPSLLDRPSLKRQRIGSQFCGAPGRVGSTSGAQGKGQSLRFEPLQAGPLKANDPTLPIVIGPSEECRFRKCGGPLRASAIHHLERASSLVPSLNFTSGGATRIDWRLCVDTTRGSNVRCSAAPLSLSAAVTSGRAADWDARKSPRAVA